MDLKTKLAHAVPLQNYHTNRLRMKLHHENQYKSHIWISFDNSDFGSHSTFAE